MREATGPGDKKLSMVHLAHEILAGRALANSPLHCPICQRAVRTPAGAAFALGVFAFGPSEYVIRGYLVCSSCTNRVGRPGMTERIESRVVGNPEKFSVPKSAAEDASDRARARSDGLPH